MDFLADQLFDGRRFRALTLVENYSRECLEIEVGKSPRRVTVQQFGLSDDIPVSGDFDSDGKDDLSVFKPSDGKWFSLRGSNGIPLIVQWGMDGYEPLNPLSGN